MDHVCHWAVSIQGAVQGAPESYLPLSGVRVPLGGVRVVRNYLCDWAVSGCCTVPRIMFAIGRCLCRVLSRVLRIIFAIGRCKGAVQGAPASSLPLGGVRVLHSTPDHVFFSLGGVCAGCCPGCSGSCLPLGGVRMLSRVFQNNVCDWVVSELSRVLSKVRSRMLRIMSGCCPVSSGLCLSLGGVRVSSRVLRIMFAIGRCQDALQGVPESCL